MGVKPFIGALALLTGALYRPCFASDVTLELRDWPAPVSCEACVTLQFGVLEMRLPTTQIGKIFISGKEPFAVHLLPKGADNARNSALFMSATRDAYIGKYQALGLGAAPSMNGQEFFDMLGRPTRGAILWRKFGASRVSIPHSATSRLRRDPCTRTGLKLLRRTFSMSILSLTATILCIRWLVR